MSNLIYEGAEFESYALFQVAFNEYCWKNAVNGIPLRFVRQNSEKLKPDTFKTETLDMETVDKFVYHNKALVCEYRTRKDGKNHGNNVNCHGRITFRYDRAKKRLLVSSFCGEHTHHPYQSVTMML